MMKNDVAAMNSSILSLDELRSASTLDDIISLYRQKGHPVDSASAIRLLREDTLAIQTHVLEHSPDAVRLVPQIVGDGKNTYTIFGFPHTENLRGLIRASLPSGIVLIEQALGRFVGTPYVAMADYSILGFKDHYTFEKMKQQSDLHCGLSEQDAPRFLSMPHGLELDVPAWIDVPFDTIGKHKLIDGRSQYMAEFAREYGGDPVIVAGQAHAWQIAHHIANPTDTPIARKAHQHADLARSDPERYDRLYARTFLLQTVKLTLADALARVI